MAPIIKCICFRDVKMWKKVWNQWNLIQKNNDYYVTESLNFPMLLITVWYTKKAYQLKVEFFMT